MIARPPESGPDRMHGYPGPALIRLLFPLIGALAISVPLGVSPALGAMAKPTALEYQAWPEYCRAKYMNTIFGKKNPIDPNYPKASIDEWNRRLGPETFAHVHHYCASLIYLQRARTAQSQKQRYAELRAAENNAKYSFQRTKSSSPLYTDIKLTLQAIQTELAMQTFKKKPAY
jgi:hypothetical protein